jgi:hypothetical protein
MVTALQEQFARKWEGKLCVLIRIFSTKNILAHWTSPEFLTEHVEPQRELPLDW